MGLLFMVALTKGAGASVANWVKLRIIQKHHEFKIF